VFEITITRDGRARKFDLHDLPLPDGRLAHTLDADELRNVLKEPLGISPNMGKQDILLRYAQHKADHQ
jgi:hypothetical protein